ncbi:rod shape-determining protein MreD [bacterium]|nr:rod shape-determining protein MreD [bacterium]
MKKKNLYHIVLLFLIILIQSTRFDFWAIRGIKPDLILLLIFAIAIKEGSISGTIFGFAGGIAQDIFSNGLLGAGAFAKSLWGYMMGKSNQRLDTGSMTVQILLILFFSICDGLLINLFMWGFRHPFKLQSRFIFFILGQAGYNCIIWPLFAYILDNMERRTVFKTGN